MKLIKKWNLPLLAKSVKYMGNKAGLFLGCVVGFCLVELFGTVSYTFGIRAFVSSLGVSELTWFWQSLGLMTAGLAVWWLYTPVSAYLCDRASKGTIREIKISLSEHIFRLPMLHHDKKAKSEYIAALTNDISSLQRIYDWYFCQICRSASGGLGGVLLMLLLDWRFALVVILCGSVSVLISLRFSKKLENAGAELQEKLHETGSDFYELVKAAKAIRLLEIQRLKGAQTVRQTQDEAEIRAKSGSLMAGMSASVTTASALSYIAVLGFGALFVTLGITQWATVIALMSLRFTTEMLFVELPKHLYGMQLCTAGIGRIDALEGQREEELTVGVYARGASPLELKNVDFAYGQSPVVRAFNLTLPGSGITLLLGRSGCGKSTVLKLAMALYTPDKGEISFSGLEKPTFAEIRKLTAYVPQNASLIRGTILENITCGICYPREEAVSAAVLAGADVFISQLEHGYETQLTDDAQNLSAGQRQRLAIARALIKRAPVLLLDEPTSALDKKTAGELLMTLQNLSKTHAILLITHDEALSAIADKVYRMEP